MRFWNNLSSDQWNEQNKEEWNNFVSGKTTLVLPDLFYRMKTEFGMFIQIQPNNLLSGPPGLFVRTSHYGPTMKVLLPNNAKSGDKIRIVRKSKSGKSLIAKIEGVAT